MNRSKYMADRLEEVLLNGKWIANTNFKKLIENISWEAATQKNGSLNSIASLTFHVNYFVAGISNVLDGGELEIRDKYSYDMKAVESASDWKNLVEKFCRDAEKFINQIKVLEDSVWDETFVKEEYGTYLRNIEGVIEHSYYHLGQISLMRKWLDDNSNSF